MQIGTSNPEDQVSWLIRNVAALSLRLNNYYPPSLADAAIPAIFYPKLKSKLTCTMNTSVPMAVPLRSFFQLN